ncbi:MAG: methyltransferase domain-containing protein [Nitrososphaerota archaeon]|nr:class I SAM-dependent methyltransferase [Candidatus Bathyarchaeota archaeon]MDW8023456.1 methyltransferase domain-containing protein [Nitrososphaerota archaeon]
MAKRQTSFEEYARKLNLNKLFEVLGAPDPKLLAREVEYFTVEEAERRDEMLINYFGDDGVNRIVDKTVKLLFAFPRLSASARVLDVGAGTGFFTAKIAEKVHVKLPKVSFYAMDATPSMLLSLAGKYAHLKPFVGLAENIKGSIAEARRFFNIPEKFDVALSTLMLHHSADPVKVFHSMRNILKENGKALVVDLCEHGFEEFKKEMGDVHLGFKPERIYEMASEAFSKVKVERISGIGCECSGRRVEIFFAYMYGV